MTIPELATFTVRKSKFPCWTPDFKTLFPICLKIALAPPKITSCPVEALASLTLDSEEIEVSGGISR
ncbi:hypothetical protein NC651_005346 [Populus alba x Populus x berolinensis]|nr:hypothetical protein NC651_005346 [Populus alba x Populus x berolinensis]